MKFLLVNKETKKFNTVQAELKYVYGDSLLEQLESLLEQSDYCIIGLRTVTAGDVYLSVWGAALANCEIPYKHFILKKK